ncbi:MAG TPA: asparagine synthase C-terminal domain-containing protein, partial [Methylomirabilota bacterium]|nr:asparagine synthase C-terminal domain-containing protein [Methylomirabilota bacterium]
YADIPGLARTSAPMLAAFFREGLTEVDAPDYSHAIRWRNGRRLRCFFAAETLRAVAAEGGDARRPALPAAFAAWGPLERAQFLEIDLFLSHYLLSSQGDRVAMAHSVEGRFPFLDHRVVEFCTRLPARFKLRALTEKYLLRQLGRELLPEAIWTRPKRPYRAPIHRSFFHAKTPDYVRQLLSPAALAASGWFRPEAVARLVQKIEAGRGVSEADDMALAGILSTQLVHQQFISGFRRPLPLSAADRVKVCRPNAVLSPP